MSDLVGFLRARLDEDEATARAVQESRPGPWAVRADSIGNREIYSVPRDDAKGWDSNVIPETWNDEATTHIARWNPARVLAEVKAKREILEWNDAPGSEMDPSGWVTYDLILQALATPYADHPDFNPAWRAEL